MPHTSIAEMAAQAAAAEAAARAAQPNQNKNLAYLLAAALLIYGGWPVIKEYVPDNLNPVSEPSPFGDSVNGLHVLIALPAEANPTEEQNRILNSVELISLIESAPGADRSNRKYLDTETVFDDGPAMVKWKAAMEKAKATGKPWSIVVGNKGKGGYVGELPATYDETVALIKKYL